MLVKPYRLRVGVLSPEDGSLDLINELMRSTISTANEAMCSFYVPLLTPIAFMLLLEFNASRETVKISFRYGSTIIEDEFLHDNDTIRVYGNGASKTGFAGKDFDLLASEESIEIRMIAIASERILATFYYKHLDPSEAPLDLNLTEIDYSNESSLQCLRNSTGAENDNVKQDVIQFGALKRSIEAVDIDSDTSVDEDVSITPKKPSKGRSNLMPLNANSSLFVADRQSRLPGPSSSGSCPSTPFRQTKMRKSISPSKEVVRPIISRSISNVKAEEFELKAMPKFEPSPSVQLLKDSQKKVAALDGQIESDEIQLEGLEDKRQVKLSRAKSNYEKALIKADREYTSDRARIEEHIEQALMKRDEELKKQEWLQTKAMENVEVIELSDDSASDGASDIGDNVLEEEREEHDELDD